MPKVETEQFTKHFAAMGAPNPESWADAHVNRGGGQWARFLFLRTAWSYIVEEGDHTWMDSLTAASKDRPNDPGAGIGPALQRLRALGAQPEDINEVVRVMQWELLFQFCYLLGDSGMVDYASEDLPRVGWRLFEVDDDGKPIGRIIGLEEGVLGMDPTGREMRPKTAKPDA